MLSFFFIPATKLSKIDTINAVGVDEIIIDFEDAITENDRSLLIHKIINVKEYKKYWYRIPCRNKFDDDLDSKFLIEILDLGIKKIIIPKLKSKEDIEEVFNSIKSFDKMEFIILIEHPKLLLEFLQILQCNKYEQYIVGIGLGSHDMMSFLSAEYVEEKLIYPRTKVLYLAKAFNKIAIDIASMNISNKIDFEKELKFGLEHGYDAKFLIHPNQIEWLNNFEDVKEKQMKWANRIISALKDSYNGKGLDPFILDGQIIEKPHVDKAFAILKRYINEK